MEHRQHATVVREKCRRYRGERCRISKPPQQNPNPTTSDAGWLFFAAEGTPGNDRQRGRREKGNLQFGEGRVTTGLLTLGRPAFSSETQVAGDRLLLILRGRGMITQNTKPLPKLQRVKAAMIESLVQEFLVCRR